MPVVRPIPVFPLPDVVFFPGTVLPLHVFETRYRAMVKDAVAADGTIAVALLQPGWEQRYEGSPAYYPIATAGRMDDIQTTPDGRYYFKLSGLTRVRLGAVIRETPYRLVEAVDLPELPVDESDAALQRAKLDLLASQLCVVRALTGSDHPRLVLDERLTFAAAVNGACASLPAEPAIRQSLLELDDLTDRHRRAMAVLDEILRRVVSLREAAEGQLAARDLN
jgi:Lon protease-like protein